MIGFYKIIISNEGIDVMKNILIHGLGQNEISWNKVEEELKNNNTKVEIPSLYLMLKDITSD